MKLLLDTHVVIWSLDRSLQRRFPAIADLVMKPSNTCYVSAASLWEINIKHEIGKLEIDVAIGEIPHLLESQAMMLIGIAPDHAIARIDPPPTTRDPFDRLLLAQARVEGMQLVTADRALMDHPLAWSAGR
jgi:PIN domain nuclease of toxin-antitoxin system